MTQQFIKVYPKGLDKKLSENFHLREFDCKCESCTETIVNMVHIARLEQLRREINKPIKITSGFRCKDHNYNIGGTKNSQHLLGNASDIALTAIDEDKLKRIFIGVILYDTFTHLDSRESHKIFLDKRNKH